MKKQLIEAHMVKDFIGVDNKIYIDNNMVLTPGARDILNSQGVEMIRSKQRNGTAPRLSLQTCLPARGITPNLEMFTTNLTAMLQKTYGIKNQEELGRYTQKAIQLIKENL